MAPDETTDGTLALRVQGEHGDREAEAILFRRFAPRIRLYGLCHLRDEAKADDLVQHVMVLLIENLRAGRVREPERLASFVLGSCRMVVLDLKRGDGRRQRLLDHYGLPSETPSDTSTELDLERLRNCVEKLPFRERTVAILSFYAERSSDEIARELTMTPGNVRVVRHRALGHLQGCMGLVEKEAT